MASVKSQLISGESLIIRSQIHPIAYFMPASLFWAILTLGLYWVYVYIKINTQESAVTDRRVLSTRGILDADSMSINHKSVQDTQIHQTWIGRIFGYGTITISGKGTDFMTLPYLSHAKVFYQAIVAMEK